jgi:hypothetical protein
MHYLIDGYNLLHQIGRLRGRQPANLEAARLDLLRQLQYRFAVEPAEITVVFDARGGNSRGDGRQEYHGIAIRFTHCEEADDLIESMIRTAPVPRELTVVTNDRRIREAARRRECPVRECIEFWEWLSTRPKPHTPPPADGDGERPTPSRDEVDEWSRTFGDLDDDPAYRELFGPDEFDDPK